MYETSLYFWNKGVEGVLHMQHYVKILSSESHFLDWRRAYKLDPRQSFSWFGLHSFGDKLLPSYINNQNEQLTTQGFRGCGLDAEKRPSD